MNNYATLTTVADIKALTSISNNVQSELIEPYIVIAEEFYAYDILGDALLSELRDQVTGNTVTGITASTITPLNQILLVQYIHPLVAFGTWFEYIPFSYIKTVQKGEVTQTSDNSTTPALDELNYKKQAIKDKVQYYQDRLKGYLEKNKSNYPLYRSTCEQTNTSATGIFLNYR